jgi:serine/threonine protein kinase
MGLDERTGGLIAVKEIAFTPRDKQMVLQLQAEVELLAACQHPNIIRYLGTEVERADSSEDESLLYIFSEWVPGGSIHTVIQQFGQLSESVRDEDSFPIVFWCIH